MPDKGTQIVMALLEKREFYLVTKDSNTGLVAALLRAERLGYVQKEHKNALYTLSEKGRKWVYSGYYLDEAEYGNKDNSFPEIVDVMEPTSKVNGPTLSLPSTSVYDIREKGRLPLIYAMSLLLGLLVLVLALAKWLLGPGS